MLNDYIWPILIGLTLCLIVLRFAKSGRTRSAISLSLVGLALVSFVVNILTIKGALVFADKSALLRLLQFSAAIGGAALGVVIATFLEMLRARREYREAVAELAQVEADRRERKGSS